MRTVIIVSAAVALGLSGCAEDGIEPTPIAVNTSDSACDVMPNQAPAGPVVFSIQNSGTSDTDFSLLGANAEVIGEVENIGPGVSRDLIIDVQTGTYVTSCTITRDSERIRAEFTVVTE